MSDSRLDPDQSKCRDDALRDLLGPESRTGDPERRRESEDDVLQRLRDGQQTWDDVLRLFRSGKLNGPLFEWVGAHIEGCDACSERLEILTGSLPSLVGDIRALGGTGDLSEPGRYSVHFKHAEGGLGKVSVALDHQFDREIAYKQVRDRDRDDPAKQARLRFEALVTGLLEHPGIVPIYSRGTDPEGRPFYTMRFIRGETLHEDVEQFHRSKAAAGSRPGEHAVALQGLLRRFLDVCNTIAYAHSRGVMHRDIKPSNIMLGPFGETLVVDWGLAKAIGREDLGSLDGERPLTPGPDDGAVETLRGQPIGTPQYMSPEQARGDLEAMGPLSDVYSLGATLYDLLTGQPPFRGDDLRAVERGEFRAPRQVDPTIDRALEAVCLKAMATRPEGRYDSALALKGDLEAWLADQPVSAWTEPRVRRAARWVRHHGRAAAAVASAVVAGLTMGLVGLGVVLSREQAHTVELAQADNETQRWLNRAFDAFDGYHTTLGDEPALKGPRFVPVRARLVQRPRQFYQDLIAEYRGAGLANARGRYRLARGLNGYGKILRMLGRPADAMHQFEEAVAVSDGVQGESDSLPLRVENARGLSNLAVMRAEGRDGGAERAYREAIGRLDVVTSGRPDRPEAIFEVATARANLGNLLRELRRLDDARRELEIALPLFEAATAARPGDARLRRGLANACNTLGVLHRDSRRLPEAEGYFRRAVSGFDVVTSDGTRPTDDLVGIARAAMNLALVLDATGRQEAARALYRKAAPLSDSLRADFPDLPEYTQLGFLCHLNCGALLRAMNLSDEAVAEYQKAADALKALSLSTPSQPGLRLDLARLMTNIANAHATLGRFGPAEAARLEAIAVLGDLKRKAPGDSGVEHELGRSWSNLAQDRLAQRRNADAEDALRVSIGHLKEALRLAPGTVPSAELCAETAVPLAVLLSESSRCEEAVALVREVRDLAPDLSEVLFHSARGLAACARSMKSSGDRDHLAAEAADTLRRALDRDLAAPFRAAIDTDLLALGGRTDFGPLFAVVYDRIFPADPFAGER